MTDLLAETLAWAARTDAPNGLLLLAALTRPTKWSQWASGLVEQYVGGSGGDGKN